MTDEIRCPTIAELISTWESGLGRPGHERALLLLGRAVAGASEGELARWSLGRRDSALCRLRRMLFGEELNSVARCPHCRAELELTFAISDIWREDNRPVEGSDVLEIGGFPVNFRVPDSTDLEAARQMDTVEAARRRLLERCILSDVPESGAEAIAAAISARERDADRRIGVTCQECGESWEEIFDISAWLWHEISAFVRRIVREVHALASAYGWREEEILSMSATRRQLYLGILAQASI